ncbi:MAG: radical SAM protein [Candidatus Brocadiaceae bacterium]
MSIVLLEPPRPENPSRFEDVVNAPLSACLFTGYISAVLHAHKIEAVTVNAYLYDWSIEQTISDISKKNPLLLCVHIVYLWERTQDIFDMLSTIKSKNLAMHINLYGYYPTFVYKNILGDFSFIDSVTVGEPEFTTLELARHILQNRDSHEICIPGLAYRNNQGKVVFSLRPPVQDLDQLPYPRRQDIELYKKKGIVTYIQGSRGCYGHCTFCYLNPFYDRVGQWRGRSAQNIFEEMLVLFNEHSVDNFYFSDANFFGPGRSGKERAITLAELILAHDMDIRFGFECRANDIETHSISKLVMAGLTNVFLGLESGDQASLKRFRKHTTVDENKRAIQLLREYGIEPTYGFIMFEPNSNMKSIRNNFEFLKEAGIMTNPAVTAHVLYHKQTLFAGTPDYQAIIQESPGDGNTFSNYEAMYTIKDPKVEAFSQIIAHLCKTTLSLLPATYDCNKNALSCVTASASLEATVNDALIALFEKTLVYFETNTQGNFSDTIREMKQKLTDEMKTVIQPLSFIH